MTTWTTKDGDPVGAWVFKANPKVFDAHAELDDTGEILNWAVRESYRLDLMRAGQPALLWIAAGGRSRPAGFYAAGTITDPRPSGGIGSGEHWQGRSASTPQDLFVGVTLKALASPISKQELTETGELGKIEPIRAAQLSNPSWLLGDEYELLCASFDLTTLEPTDEQRAYAVERDELDEIDRDLIEIAYVEAADGASLDIRGDAVTGAVSVQDTVDADGDISKIVDFATIDEALTHYTERIEHDAASSPAVIVDPFDADQLTAYALVGDSQAGLLVCKSHRSTHVVIEIDADDRAEVVGEHATAVAAIQAAIAREFPPPGPEGSAT